MDHSTISNSSKTNKGNFYKRLWTKEEDEALIKYFLKYRTLSKRWKKIASLIRTKTSEQCYNRYRHVNPSYKSGPWDKHEENMLVELVKIHGKKWEKISKIIGSRSGKQLRQHYVNFLDLERNRLSFSAKEDEKIKELYLLYGTKWRKIAKSLNGKTGETVRMRFESKIKSLLEEEEKEVENNGKYSLLILLFKRY